MTSVLLSAGNDRVTVAPGSSVEFNVTVQNLTTLVDQVTMRVDGVDAQWVQIVPPFLPVFAQGTASARVIVSPPGQPGQSPAGSYPLRITGTSQERPGESAAVSVALEVQLTGNYQLRLGPPQPGAAPQELRFPVRVINGANASLMVQPAGRDRGSDLWYKFEPFQLNVAPGSEGTLMLTARAKQMTPGQRAVAFAVSTNGTFTLRDGAAMAAPAQEVAGQFGQSALAALIVSLAPTQLEAPVAGVFQVRVGNPGAIPVIARLSVADAADGLSFKFAPEQITLGPQSEQRATLSVSAAAPLADGAAQRIHDFRVSAEAADGLAQPGSAAARFVQVAAAKPFPWALVIGLLTLALFACFVIAYLLVNTYPR